MPTTAELLAQLRARADDVRAQIAAIRAETEERIAPLQRELDEAMGLLERASDEGILTNVRPTVKPFDMAKPIAARRRISAGRFRSEGTAETAVAKGLERVGWSFEDLSKAIAEHPTIKGHIMGGYKKQQLAAAAKHAHGDQRQVPIRKIVALAAQAVTTRKAVKADPAHGIEARDAYDGIPLSAWGRVID